MLFCVWSVCACFVAGPRGLLVRGEHGGEGGVCHWECVPIHQVYQGRCPWPKYLQHHPPWRPCTVQCHPTAHYNRLAKSQSHFMRHYIMTEAFIRWQICSCDTSTILNFCYFIIMLFYTAANSIFLQETQSHCKRNISG